MGSEDQVCCRLIIIGSSHELAKLTSRNGQVSLFVSDWQEWTWPSCDLKPRDLVTHLL